MATAQTLTTLYSFDGGQNGATPYAGLIQGSDGFFYGTTSSRGANNYGTVFRIDANGNFTNLHSFANGSDGAVPYAGLVEGADGYFYGTTASGGASNYGTVFRISASVGLTNLHSFAGGDGVWPYAALSLGDDGNFYGATVYGGANNTGTVFQIGTNGSFATVHDFSVSDGVRPYAGLARGDDGDFYGTTVSGGANNAGTVFRVSSAGNFTNLYSFSGGDDGAASFAGLIAGGDGNFYGVTTQGGANNWGTVFRIAPRGGFTNLYSFMGGNDGGFAFGKLAAASDGNFYGTTFYGGAGNHGTVFRISPAGSFTNLYAFSGGSDGAAPFAGLVLASDGNLYGTTVSGGVGFGTIFRIVLNSPPLAKCKSRTILAGVGCTANVSVDDGSSDPDLGDTITLTQSPAGPYPWGDTVVTLAVTDNHGVSSFCSAIVSVVDATAPSIQCPANIIVDATSAAGALVIYAAPQAADNCGVQSVVCTPGSGGTLSIGSHTVNCTAVDPAGNSNSCTFSIRVQGPHDTVAGILGQIEAVQNAETNKHIRHKLDQVIRKLGTALYLAWWLDDTHLTLKGGGFFFNRVSQATRTLTRLTKAMPELQSIIDQEVRSARILVETALPNASGKGYARALKKLAEGDAKATAGKASGAIRRYKDAWKAATH
jgi:uncharacterized repeat protein (TIGR03803 family)